MLNLITKLIAIAERLIGWFTGCKEARKRDDVRKAVAEHDREAMNRILQERRDGKR